MDHKNLIVYFSWSGNTQFIAEKIQKQADGNFLKIEPAQPYDSDYHTTAYGRAKEEHDKHIHPEIKPVNLSVLPYDRIFLGTPVWWYTMAPVVMTYLEQNDFKGKTIIPFVTHGGGGGYSVDQDIAQLAKGATVLKPLVLFERGPANADEVIAQWLP